jgi:uncharacterized protein
MKNALIIFAKYPELGKVKTRLAREIGDQKALRIYFKLFKHVLNIAKQASEQTFVFLANKNPDKENLIPIEFSLRLQNNSPDLGVRMKIAFDEMFEEGFEKILLTGTDIYEISSDYFTEGFNCLSKKDAIIGKALDGGYYMIGLTKKTVQNHPELLSKLFLNRTWSHENVAQEALSVFNELDLKYEFLPALRDIDTLEDLKHYPDLTIL